MSAATASLIANFKSWGWFLFRLLIAPRFLVWVISLPWPNDKAASAACDRAVATLLDTHDAVDLMRADILIRDLNCSIRRRLPAM